jgi:DNA invertase Pin-like site-specific DNA recombinase
MNRPTLAAKSFQELDDLRSSRIGSMPMANALVIRRSHLPKALKDTRAAQYVRMSTNLQKYSIENQAAVIGVYAQAHGLSIVRTYRDEGESGLKLKNRAGLIQLLDDVQSGCADFDHILVFDVSRWGRFQDIDESAHYEFLCKQAGIQVTYCAEQFPNDGTMLSSIVKNIKRVMAAEWSRDLSGKVHAGACRLSRLGFKIGGRPSYGLQRVLVDERMKPKTVLRDGDRKYLMTDHVRLRPGTTDEVAVVRWIFQEFLERTSETSIARDLNQKGIPTNTANAWDRAAIGRILRNENYIGNILYNRHSLKLGEKRVNNPPEQWIRSEGCVEPIISRDTFLRVQKLIEVRRVDLPEPEMLLRLRKTLAKRRKLSPTIINETPGLPCTATFMQHFGTLREAYRLVGYTPGRNYDYLDFRLKWISLKGQLASQVADRLTKTGEQPSFDKKKNCLPVNRNVTISFRFARWYPGKRETHAPYWAVARGAYLPPGWIIVIRLSERNKDVLDYILVPTTIIEFKLLRFSEKAREARGIESFRTFDKLLQSLTRKLSKSSRAVSAKPQQSSQSARRPQFARMNRRERP